MASAKVSKPGHDKKMKKSPEEVKEKTNPQEKAETKTKEKTEKGKKGAEKKIKDKAIANGYSLRISPKQVVAICKVIQRKSPEAAVERLHAVIEGKRAIPMANLEVAHQKGKGLSGAKYPKNACQEIIKIINQVTANAVVNGIENPVIVKAISNRASRPYRRAGIRARRTHVYIEVMDKSKLMEKK